MVRQPCKNRRSESTTTTRRKSGARGNCNAATPVGGDALTSRSQGDALHWARTLAGRKSMKPDNTCRGEQLHGTTTSTRRASGANVVLPKPGVVATQHHRPGNCDRNTTPHKSAFRPRLTLELSRPATCEPVSCCNGTTAHLNEATKRVRLE